MRYLLSVFLICFVILTQAQPKKDLKAIVQQSHENFIRSILAEDYKTLGNVLADDLTLGTPNGGFETKEHYIGVIKNGRLFYDSAANHAYTIRVYGNTGIVTGKVDLVFRYRNDENKWVRMLEHLTFTSVHVVTHQTAQMVAWQSNRPVTDTLEHITQ